MNFLSWNCPGLGNPRTVQELGGFIRSKSPMVMFLCEIKCNSRTIENLKAQFDFFRVLVPSMGRSGGRALLRKRDVVVSLRSFSRNFIDASITVEEVCFHITGVYGEPDVSKRRAAWERFRELHTDPAIPWLCFGDFNEVLTQAEFSSRNLRADWQINCFKSAIDFCGLHDMGFSGNKFTWEGFLFIRLLNVLGWTDFFPPLIGRIFFDGSQ